MKHIKTPTLLIDKHKAISNIQMMKQKADANGIVLRPHFKTHQSAEVGEWFRSEGINQITVSSVKMAAFFANHGWYDITIAFPLNIRELDEIEALSRRIKLNVLISAKPQIEALSQSSVEQVGYFVKIDAGNHRAGFKLEQIDEIKNIVEYQDNKLIFKGFVAHFGHTYHAQGVEEISEIYHTSVDYLTNIANKIETNKNFIISIGDTPSCSIIDNYERIHEIRPGNFVYYDLMQMRIGSCTETQIAAVVACPVIDKNIARNELLIYGGAVHFSKDYIIDNRGNTCFGIVVNLNENGWTKSIDGAYVKSLSQEHGIILCSKELLSKVKIGDLIGVIPVHSCLAADLLKNNQYLNQNI